MNNASVSLSQQNTSNLCDICTICGNRNDLNAAEDAKEND